MPYAQYLLGFNFFNLKQYQQANDYFSKCQKNEGLEKDNLSLYGNATYFLGMVNHILGQYDVSIDYFQKYLTVYTGSALQPEFLAQANYFMGANLFRQLEEKMTKGDISKMSESAQAILPYLNKAVEMKILIEDAYVMLGNCYVYIKNYDQAIKTYQQLCEFFPQSLQLKNYQDFLQELQKIQQQEQKPKKKR
jgi:tetratricopeptide (TPR) repeat protein